jgi:hypothetical protein
MMYLKKDSGFKNLALIQTKRLIFQNAGAEQQEAPDTAPAEKQKTTEINPALKPAEEAIGARNEFAKTDLADINQLNERLKINRANLETVLAGARTIKGKEQDWRGEDPAPLSLTGIALEAGKAMNKGENPLKKLIEPKLKEQEELLASAGLNSAENKTALMGALIIVIEDFLGRKRKNEESREEYAETKLIPKFKAALMTFQEIVKNKFNGNAKEALQIFNGFWKELGGADLINPQGQFNEKELPAFIRMDDPKALMQEFEKWVPLHAEKQELENQIKTLEIAQTEKANPEAINPAELLQGRKIFTSPLTIKIAAKSEDIIPQLKKAISEGLSEDFKTKAPKSADAVINHLVIEAQKISDLQPEDTLILSPEGKFNKKTPEPLPNAQNNQPENQGTPEENPGQSPNGQTETAEAPTETKADPTNLLSALSTGNFSAILIEGLKYLIALIVIPLAGAKFGQQLMDWVEGLNLGGKKINVAELLKEWGEVSPEVKQDIEKFVKACSNLRINKTHFTTLFKDKEAVTEILHARKDPTSWDTFIQEHIDKNEKETLQAKDALTAEKIKAMFLTENTPENTAAPQPSGTSEEAESDQEPSIESSSDASLPPVPEAPAEESDETPKS